ncbi:hypothetical protein E4T56_gene9407, partial [Termitomyces sp. T112]
MIIATTENIAGYRVTANLGQVFGVVVRSRGLAGNFMATLRTILGGEIKELSALVEDTRRHAIDRLVTNAAAMGADAVSSPMARRSGSRNCDHQCAPAGHWRWGGPDRAGCRAAAIWSAARARFAGAGRFGAGLGGAGAALSAQTGEPAAARLE